jgi:curved DNA-binding protein CbpA
VPPDLVHDFELLGVEVGANLDVCKIAYKKLLMKNHPDKFAEDEHKMKAATEKSSKINVAFDRIEKYYNNKPF